MIKGFVEAEIEFYSGEKEVVSLGNNMILDNMASQIVKALTISPAFSEIPSASSFLDTSNFTIHALSFGKPAESYELHAHNLTDGSNYTVYGETSSYSTSSQTKVGEPPRPTDNRLERRKTDNIPAYDVGHNVNKLIVAEVTGVSSGSFPVSSGSTATIRRS